MSEQKNQEERCWKVYVHTVPKEISGYDWDKHYFGITKRAGLERWGQNGVGYKNKCHHLWNAIQKYGWDNMIHEILMSSLTKEEACCAERWLVSTYKSNDNRYGYNITEGGICGNVKQVYPVKMYDSDGKYLQEFESAAAAARYLGCDRSRITACCRYRLTRYKGLQFRYSNDNPPGRFREERQRSVLQFDLNANLVNKYFTAADAIKQNPTIIKGHIYGALIRYKTHVSENYFWIYEDDYVNNGGLEYVKQIISNNPFKYVKKDRKEEL